MSTVLPVARDSSRPSKWIIVATVVVYGTIGTPYGGLVSGQLPISLQNLVVENVAISECANSSITVLPGGRNCLFGEDHRTICFRTVDIKRATLNERQFNETRELILCHWMSRTFNPQLLAALVPNVEKFALTGKSLRKLTGAFPAMPKLRMINITGTQLNSTRAGTFSELRALEVLNLRGNALVEVDAYKFRSPHVDIYLHGNFWNCTRDMIWLLEEQSNQYADKATLVCKDWKYTGRPVLTAMEFKQVLRQNCQHEEIWNCTCRISYLRLSDSGLSFHPMVTVNCSNLGYHRLPSYLPGNTTVLHASGNKITDVNMLTTHECYRSVQDIYLDDNRISSIDILEDTVWLDNFRILSLTRNHLDRIRVYSVEHALERNVVVGKLYLASNPWRCGCRFAIRFQRFLRKHESVVTDARNITCYHINDEGTKLFLPVITLTPNDICRSSETNKAAIYDTLSIIFGTLIVLIFAKLGYDYYNYRKYGKLPWLIMKMP